MPNTVFKKYSAWQSTLSLFKCGHNTALVIKKWIAGANVANDVSNNNIVK